MGLGFCHLCGTEVTVPGKSTEFFSHILICVIGVCLVLSLFFDIIFVTYMQLSTKKQTRRQLIAPLQILAGYFGITVVAMLNKQLMHKSSSSMMTDVIEKRKC
jgi:hypothetical protein